MPATYDEAQTLVQARQLADQIVRDLEATKSRPIPHVGSTSEPPPALEPEELLPPPSLPPSNIYETAWSSSGSYPPYASKPSYPPYPAYASPSGPWSATLPIVAAPALLKKTDPSQRKKKARRRKTKSRLHWAVLAMAVGIAIGLWRDPHARVNAQRQLTTESHRVANVVSAKAASAKAAALMTAKRVEARLASN